jgi:hypothetical protein
MSDGGRQPCPKCGALNYVADDVCMGCGYDLPPAEAQQAPVDPPRPERRTWWAQPPGSYACGCLAVGCLVAGVFTLLIGLAPQGGPFSQSRGWFEDQVATLALCPFAAVGGLVGWLVSPALAERLGWRHAYFQRMCVIAGLLIGSAVGIAFYELSLGR